MSDKGAEQKVFRSMEIDKWLSVCQYILQRRDGRDRLNYETLYRALRELRWRRRIDLALEKLVDDATFHATQMTPAVMRKTLATILSKAKEAVPMGTDLDKIPMPKGVPDEIMRAGLVEKINQEILKPAGFVLILRYENDVPVSAVFEKLGDQQQGVT